MFCAGFNSISVISQRQLTLFMSFLGFTSTRLGSEVSCPRTLPQNNPEDPEWLETRTPELRVKHFTTEPRRTRNARSPECFQGHRSKSARFCLSPTCEDGGLYKGTSPSPDDWSSTSKSSSFSVTFAFTLRSWGKLSLSENSAILTESSPLVFEVSWSFSRTTGMFSAVFSPFSRNIKPVTFDPYVSSWVFLTLLEGQDEVTVWFISFLAEVPPSSSSPETQKQIFKILYFS